jgi:beta-glucosidase
VNAYRFSVSWPRVQPLGEGAWNEAGMAFYERLVDGLIARKIHPYLTLNHWDLPQALQDKGGWASRETVHHFVAYARGIAARLGHKVASITTHNEPWVMAFLGHESGIFAPGIKSRAIGLQVAHHLLLSHGLALQALRKQGCQAELGIVLNLSPMHPATSSAADQASAHLEDGKLMRWYLDPLFKGQYPADVWAHFGADCPVVEAGDMAAIATPIDFLGINYYSRSVISADQSWDAKQGGKPLTDMGWEVYPEGLTELLVRLHQDYPVPPIYITENGGAFKDELVGEKIHDTERKTYIDQHIAALGDAIKQGVNIKGYMVWSLLDNFEWAFGYEKRFGIVHVNFATQKRTLKDSALWYVDILQQQASHNAEQTPLALAA